MTVRIQRDNNPHNARPRHVAKCDRCRWTIHFVDPEHARRIGKAHEDGCVGVAG